jgi:hypothetical protein
MQRLDLEQLERKAWTSYFEDGLWDIFFGLMMLTMGVRALTDNVWFTSMMIAGVLVPSVGKRLVTIPRIGRVKFGPARKARHGKVRAVVAISVLGTLVSLLLGLWTGLYPSGAVGAFVLAIWVPLVFGLMAYYMDFGRLYAYGLLFAASAVLWELLGSPAGPIAFSVSGSAALLVGLVLLTRFVGKYPKAAPEESLDVTA